MASKLKDFARQFNHLVLAGHLYIEHPRPNFKYLEEARWIPNDQQIELCDLIIRIAKRHNFYSHFYHPLHKCYYVIDHLWLGSLPSWGSASMKKYMQQTFSKMLSKTWVKEDKPKLLDRVEMEVEEEVFHSRFGIPKNIYNKVKEDAEIVVLKNHMHILDFCKYYYRNHQLGMNDIYTQLKAKGILTQPSIENGGREKVMLTQAAIDKGLGYNLDNKNTCYAQFYPLGVYTCSMILKDAGLVKVPLLADISTT